MSDDVWDKKRKAHEEEFFQRQEKEAMARLAKQKEHTPRICPVDGTEMEVMTVVGINVDRCTQCHGVWLDGGELEAIMKAGPAPEKNWGKKFMEALMMK